MPGDTLVDERVAADTGAVLGTSASELKAASIGKSSRRRALGITGQYAMLVVLATIVLVPLVFAVLQALSPPFSYLNAGAPLHPVDVQWKHRTWLSGGPFSVVVRTLIVVAALAWVQLKVAGGTVRHPRALAAPRRLIAVAAGTVATGVMASQIWSASVDRSPSTPAWWVGSVVLVGATQVIGFERLRPVWRPLLLGGLTGLFMTAVVVVAFGAEVWNSAYHDGNLGPALLRSLTVTTMITVAQLVTATMAAYAFAFLRFPFKNLLFAVALGTLLLPLEVTLLANVQLIRTLGWVNSNAGLVIPFAATAFGTFLIRQGFKGVPPEIQDATRLDGYGHMAFLWRFAVPLTRPVIASFTVIAALGAWNQYLWPRSVIDDSRYQTAQLALRTITGTNVAESNRSVAAALIVALPVVALLLVFSRQIIRGLTAGAVKG
jgi:sn-glycerol 3-phosphate transport system permease protein